MYELRSKEFNMLFHHIPILYKRKSGTSETFENIICTFISETLHFSASNLDPNHVLERSPPSTENLYNRFIHFYYCTTHCCEIPDHGGPELHP